MLFILLFEDKLGHKREYVCEYDVLDLAFDVVNRIVANAHNISKDYTLSKVIVYDENSIVHLPAQAFDGTTYTEALQELEQEWQGLLGNSR